MEGVVGTAVVEVAETVAAAALAGSHCRTVVEVARRSRCCMEVEVTVRRTAVCSVCQILELTSHSRVESYG